jgi:hypothetical protein
MPEKNAHLKKTHEHMPGGQFNKVLALGIKARVGSMPTFWFFCILSSLSLPATFVLMGLFAAPKSGALHFFLTFGFIYLITWICQNFIQLVLLPAIMVAQNVQDSAADARAEQMYHDLEDIRGLLRGINDAARSGNLAAPVERVSSQAQSRPDSNASSRTVRTNPLAKGNAQ